MIPELVLDDDSCIVIFLPTGVSERYATEVGETWRTLIPKNVRILVVTKNGIAGTEYLVLRYKKG